MKSMNRKDVVELIGIVAIVASLIFVGVQVSLDREIAVAEGNLANAANSIEANNAFLDNSDVWVRGSSGERLDEENAVVFRYLVKNVHDVARMEFTRLNRLGDDEIAQTVAADFSAFLFRNPGARALWVQQHQENLEYRRVILGNEGRGAIDQTVIENLVELDRSRNGSVPVR